MVESLGPHLYGGTAGVAVFLAEAAHALGDRGACAVARGAMRHALDRGARPDTASDGLYEGSLGIVYAATRVAAALGDEELTARAREVLHAWRNKPPSSGATDVMSGGSGSVIGLIAVTDRFDEPWLADAATSLGEELIARAEKTAEGWSWPAPGAAAMQNLCGYAHGATGVGHALSELFDLTGDAGFAEGAHGAFAYERQWFDRGTGTWPDLRGVGRRVGSDAPLRGSSSWCNGASGILLSRLRAIELSPSRDVRTDAALALTACERRASELLAEAPGDFSLCHGAAAVGDVLLEASGGRDHRLAGLAAELGRWGIDGAVHEGCFNCRTTTEWTPGLQLGLAGIGLFFLRLAEPAVDGVLLVRRDA